MISPKNISVKQTKQVVHTHMYYICATMKKETMNLKESKEEHILKDLEGGKEERNDKIILNLSKKETHLKSCWKILEENSKE